MNISDLTPSQRTQVLHHLRAAAIARATQWDHEREIETILDREIDVDMSSLAGAVGTDAATLNPEDFTYLAEEDLTDWIPDED